MKNLKLKAINLCLSNKTMISFKLGLLLLYVSYICQIKGLQSCHTDEHCPPGEKCVGINWTAYYCRPEKEGGGKDQCKDYQDCKYDETCRVSPNGPNYRICEKIPRWCLDDGDCTRPGESCVGVSQSCPDFCAPRPG